MYKTVSSAAPSAREACLVSGADNRLAYVTSPEEVQWRDGSDRAGSSLISRLNGPNHEARGDHAGPCLTGPSWTTAADQV